MYTFCYKVLSPRRQIPNRLSVFNCRYSVFFGIMNTDVGVGIGISKYRISVRYFSIRIYTDPRLIHGDQSATASDCSESTSSQQPLKRFRLLTQDMMEHSSAAAVTVSNTVDTELIAYFADCKTYSENNGLKFWVTNALFAPLAQDLVSAPVSEAYVERVLSL